MNKNIVPTLLVLASLSGCADMGIDEISTTRCEFAEKLFPYTGFKYVPKDGEAHFRDVPPGSPCYLAVENLWAYGVVYPTKPNFGANLNINRGEVAKIVSKVLEIPEVSCEQAIFPDMKTHWAGTYTDALAKRGILCNLDTEKPGKMHGDCFLSDEFSPDELAETDWVDGLLSNTQNQKDISGLCDE